MSDAQSRPWTRGQDWLSLAAGAYLMLAPLWTEVGDTGGWAMVVIGLAIVAMAVIALSRPDAYVDEWTTAVGGAVAFLAPWLFGYAGEVGPAWTSWIVGVVVASAALAAVPASRRVHPRHGAHRAT